MMSILKSILFISMIALVQQGLFFSLNASEETKDKILIIPDGESVVRPSSAKDSGKEFSDKKLRYEQAKQYTEMGLVDLAMPELKKMGELYPDDTEVHAYLGWTYSQKELISDAVEEFQKVLEINPDLQRVPFDYPMVKSIPDIVKELTTSFEDVIDLIDEFPGAHEVLGLFYVLQGRLGNALKEYKKVLKLEPNYGKRDSKGDGRKTISVIDQAIIEYEEVLRSKPDCAEAYIKLACAHAEKGSLDLAIADMKKAISIKPDRIETYVYLGCFYAKKWMLDDALKELREAKGMRDHMLKKILKEGEQYIQNCMFDKAISVAKDAIKANPNDKRALLLLAMAYGKNGDTDKAIEICKEIICLYPDDLCAYTLLGWIYVQYDLLEKAMDLAERAILIEPENSGMRALKAFIYASHNQINEAITMCNVIIQKTSKEGIIKDYGWIKGNVPSIEQKFREVMDVLEIKPDYPEAYMCLGWLYSKNGENENAITSYKKAIEVISGLYRSSLESNPSYRIMLYNAYLCLGNRYVQKGEVENALHEYNNALNILSEKAQDDMKQGLAYFKNGDIERAITCFNNVLKADPEHKEAYFLLADAYEKKGLYSVGMVIRLRGERHKKDVNNEVHK